MNDAANKIERKPRPYIVRVDDAADLAWDPVAVEQYTLGSDGAPVRSGDSYAIVRPGHERWPLGHVSDVYVPTSHRRTVAMVREACSDRVELAGRPAMSGHGYRVVHGFKIIGEAVAEVDGKPFRSRLLVIHDHTGLNALRARMVCYVGEDALGSVVGARAIHVADNPARWRVEVEGMVERSQAAQAAVVAVLEAAAKVPITEADKATLTALGVNPARGKWGSTLLQSMIEYSRGSTTKQTWGTYERRLKDDMLSAMVKLLGKAKYGNPLDAALGGKRYGSYK